MSGPVIVLGVVPVLVFDCKPVIEVLTNPQHNLSINYTFGCLVKVQSPEKKCWSFLSLKLKSYFSSFPMLAIND